MNDLQISLDRRKSMLPGKTFGRRLQEFVGPRLPRREREFVPKASPVSAVESRLIFSLGGRVFNRVCTVISRRRERRGRKVKKSSRNPDRMFLHFPTILPCTVREEMGGGGGNFFLARLMIYRKI